MRLRIEKCIEVDHCPAPQVEVKSTTSAADVTAALYFVSIQLLKLLQLENME